MTTINQLERATEKTKEDFENILATSFANPKEVRDNILGLIEGNDEIELSDDIRAEFVNKYKEINGADEFHLNDENSVFAQEGDKSIQALAVSKLLSDREFASEFGEVINDHVHFSDNDVQDVAYIIESDLNSKEELELKLAGQAIDPVEFDATDSLTDTLNNFFDAAVIDKEIEVEVSR